MSDTQQPASLESHKRFYPSVAKIGQRYREAVILCQRDAEIFAVEDMMAEIGRLIDAAVLEAQFNELNGVIQQTNALKKRSKYATKTYISIEYLQARVNILRARLKAQQPSKESTE